MKQYELKIKDFESCALPQIDNLYRTALYVMDDEFDAQNVIVILLSGLIVHGKNAKPCLIAALGFSRS